MKYEHLHKLHDFIHNARNYLENNMGDICNELAEYDGDGNIPEDYINDMGVWKSELEELEEGLSEIIKTSE